MDLARAQFLSLATKAITRALGIAQTLLVVKLLGAASFGLVGLVLSVGGLIGVSQHLGIQDGAIREIAVRKSRKEIGRVFWVSNIVRQAVTIPLSLILFAVAGVVASGIYDKPEIAGYLQIFAAVLILQGLQDVFGATLTGMKRFGALYVIQIVTAVINVAVFGWLVWQFGVSGFFWAMVITTGIMVGLLAIVIGGALRGNLRLPTWADVREYGRAVVRISAYMYVARIFFVVWQRLPLLLLGGVLAAEELGYLNLSLTFGSQFVILAMALSEVNLSWMSSLYAQRRDEFVATVTRNMHRLLVLLMGMALVLLFFAPEILRIFENEFLAAQPLVLLMTAAFFLYALTDIGTSSVFVSADRPQLRALTYAVITAVTGALLVWLLLVRPDPLLAAWAVLLGAVVGYGLMVVVSTRVFKVPLLTWQLTVFLLAMAGSVAWLFDGPSLAWRIVVFGLLSLYVLWESRRSNLLPKQATLVRLLKGGRAGGASESASTRVNVGVVCFAGAEFDLPTWTNRQQIMSRVAQERPVLYVEPRVWIVRYVVAHVWQPVRVWRFLQRIVSYEHVSRTKGQRLYVTSQWNLIPGSRESEWIARFNHALNRRRILRLAKRLGFYGAEGAEENAVVWIYDTEAAEYLDGFTQATVLYDCVDESCGAGGGG